MENPNQPGETKPPQSDQPEEHTSAGEPRPEGQVSPAENWDLPTSKEIFADEQAAGAKPAQEAQVSEPAARPDEGAGPAGPERAAPAAKPESGFKRGLRAFLGTETRFGRFMRGFLRWTAAVAGLFALGLLSGYLLLYRPAQQQVRSLQSEYDQSQKDLQRAQAELDQARQNLKVMERQGQGLQKDLGTARSHVLLLSALAGVNESRMELALKKTAAAREALDPAGAALKQLGPVVAAADSDLLNTAQARLALVLTEISNDPKTAASDLEILTQQLKDLESKLVPAD